MNPRESCLQRTFPKNQFLDITDWNLPPSNSAAGFSVDEKNSCSLNLHIRKFDRESTVTMVDGSHVPVSKRKKQEFLDQLTRV
ncbi:MAG: hypothetical protein ACKVT2_07550 [Saprospiraceae bacterium]